MLDMILAGAVFALVFLSVLATVAQKAERTVRTLTVADVFTVGPGDGKQQLFALANSC